MRKTVLFIMVTFVLGGSILGCSKDADSPLKNEADNDRTNAEYQVFEAIITNTKEGLLISPDKDSVEYSSSDKILLAIKEAEIIDHEGNEIDMDILKAGDRIRVFYNGLIAESYPAQITADKIVLIGSNHIIDG